MHRRIESYEQALEFLYSRVNFERQSSHQFTVGDFKLDRMRQLLRRLGDPHLAIPSIHVAGTKGKGSTSAMIASILTASGRRTGLFTSPHISAFEERLTVDGRPPAADEFVSLVNAVAEVVVELDELPGNLGPTYFEIATALGWLYFARSQAEVVVLEVGMGGRLDSTNLCRPAVCVITSISRDHTRQLGSHVEQIAAEKAGIIKPQVPVVSGVLDPGARQVVERVSREQQSPLFQLGREFTCEYYPGGDVTQSEEIGREPDAEGIDRFDVQTSRQSWRGLPLRLMGEHQSRNAALAISVVERLREQSWTISDSAVWLGLDRVRWAGRIEVLARQPTVIVDGAHNWAAIAALVETLDRRFRARRRILVFAASRDKDVAGMLRLLLPRFDTVILTAFHNNPRNLPADELARLARSLSTRYVHLAADTTSAWKLAKRLAGPPDLICVTGSFFIAAELREQILDQTRGNSPPGMASAALTVERDSATIPAGPTQVDERE